MNTLLVNHTDGTQILLVVGEGGGYFDSLRVLWDTRLDGAMPEIILGGMVRNSSALEYNQARMDATLLASVPGIQAAIVSAVQARLDDFAKTRNYDGILSACTYATSAIPKFLGEGMYCLDARDNTWATLYTILAEVLAQTRPMPTGYADIEADLPALVWPA